MVKTIIFTDVGGFFIPDEVGNILVTDYGWKIVNNIKKEKPKSKILCFDSVSGYESINECDLWFRTNPEVIAVFEKFKIKGFKIIDIPLPKRKMQLKEYEDGSEYISEVHRTWF